MWSCAASLTLLCGTAEAELLRRGGALRVDLGTDTDLYPGVAMTSDGGFLVVWQDVEYIIVGDVLGRRFDALGAPAASSFIVGSPAYGGWAFRGRPVVSATGDDAMIVVWQGAQPALSARMPDELSLSVLARRLDSTGGFDGDTFELNNYTPNRQAGPVAAAEDGGGFVVAWASEYQDGDGMGIFARRFDSTGSAATAELQVSTRTLGQQWSPSIAALPDGEFVVVWEDKVSAGNGSYQYPILGRRFDSLGVSQGVEFQVSDLTALTSSHAAVAARDDGGFVVVWQSYSPGDGHYSILGRRFDVSGTQQAVAFEVSSSTQRGHIRPALTMTGGGEFMVVWQSYLEYYSPDAVLAQLFDAGASALGVELQVASSTGLLRYPAVATDGAGHFVVAWHESLPTAEAYVQDHRIFAQRFASALATVDIDGDGEVSALIDGVLVLRHRLGFSGAGLVGGGLGAACTRCDATVISDYVESILAEIDVDGDGTVGALTDALLILRFAFGFRGAVLEAGIVGESCTRCAAAALEAFLVPLFA